MPEHPGPRHPQQSRVPERRWGLPRVTVELGQWLAGGRAPERQFTVMLRRRHIDYDLERLAVVHHPASLREVATAITAAAGRQATLIAANEDVEQAGRRRARAFAA